MQPITSTMRRRVVGSSRQSLALLALLVLLSVGSQAFTTTTAPKTRYSLQTNTNSNTYFFPNSNKLSTSGPLTLTPITSSTLPRSPFRLYAADPNNNSNNEKNGINGANDSDDSTGITSISTNGGSTSTTLTAGMEPQVFGQRWIQLAYLSLLALLSDWICFSTAATPQVYQSAFDHSSASLIDIFLFTNVATCFLVTDLVNKFGLQRAIQGASVLMLSGCWLRSGFDFLLPHADTAGLVSYPLMVLGTVLVGAAQPFFQCTPPLLSALWFASSERATSTAIALNFNQIGIATAFLVGGSMATSAQGLENYFGLIAVACTLVTAGTLFQFADEPPIPPSASELEKKLSGEQEPPFLESVQHFFGTAGFAQALAAFVCSISMTNVVGAFVEEIMERGGVTNQLTIDLSGAGFELAILIGGIFIGGFVDRTKEYKNVTLACLAVAALLALPLGLQATAAGPAAAAAAATSMSSMPWRPVLLVGSLLGLGLAVGPVQPINAELAVDVTYPGDETAVESVQQIGGNLLSALIIPIAEMAANEEFGLDGLGSVIHGDALLLCGMAISTIAFFSTFNAPLKRSEADSNADSLHDNSVVEQKATNGDAATASKKLNGVDKFSSMNDENTVTTASTKASNEKSDDATTPAVETAIAASRQQQQQQR